MSTLKNKIILHVVKYMVLFRFLILVSLLMHLSSCSNKRVTDNDIDEFISMHLNEGFENLKGISIIQRGKSFCEIVYVVDKYNVDKPPYFVEYSIFKKSITNINKSLLENDSIPDYLTQMEITDAVNTIRKYDFYFLAVDSLENVYINPFYANKPAYFLRLKIGTGDSIVQKTYNYKLYRDNWYVNRRD